MTEIKARPTLYRGIRMRSRLEADFARFLDLSGAEWEYEPTCFAGPQGQWLPDFRAIWTGHRAYFEVKPESFPDDQIDVTLERMTVAWLSEPEAVLQLVIWPYGDPASSFSVVGFPHEDEDDDDLIWWSMGDGERMTPWPGMGQLETYIERGRRERETEAADGREPEHKESP